MSILSGEKRKNDEPRRFQWWLLVIGIVIGLLLSLVVMQSRFSGTVFYIPDNANFEGLQPTVGVNGSQLSDEALYMTATQIIRQATIEAPTPSP